VTVLNFGTKPSKLSFLAAFTFMGVAILALFYSMGIYLYRSQAIRGRKAIKYHDAFGPTVLCIVLLVAIILNIWYEAGTRGFLSKYLPALWFDQVVL